ncbi:PREDICTED: inositol polyphosphate 1-phosphatase [Nicrophorus vespilloides]|uniref:Inositol polyphosphate 1-phosphatase n=1 Tax=Nicrophorus vespilloides TaxID=110193 RepID=A0ABM1NKG8_NICVS|nr:PREDICTED: inositol polyphosphate 1-phosphatase [Nicrophorus vespilloides]
MLRDLLEALVVVSEKAANIARICRQDDHLFGLLVQEKEADQSNPRFVQDFKTLADVLIQETVKHDIGNAFPVLRDKIHGEEDNVFCNTLGEEIRVEIQTSSEATAELLEKVLDGDGAAARLLANEVHREISASGIPEIPSGIPAGNVGIWIDPIDSTAEYIGAKETRTDCGVSVSGLSCVTVLIGVYQIETGLPILGIVNQPFSELAEDNRWRGRCHWGVSLDDLKLCSAQPTHHRGSKLVCLSSSEDAAIKEKLESKGFRLIEAAGAGYKILCTITGSADAYVLSKGSTYKWDTCGPQAVLKSLGGDVVQYSQALEDNLISVNYPTDYENKLESCCNRSGLIAYRDPSILQDIYDALKA